MRGDLWSAQIRASAFGYLASLTKRTRSLNSDFCGGLVGCPWGDRSSARQKSPQASLSTTGARE